MKLIDFGSAIMVDPNEPRPFYTLFYGTAAYASSEILRKMPYQAQPAEVWTLGVLLSYLLFGVSPFPSSNDSIAGRITIPDTPTLSPEALDILQACLDPDPRDRANISEIKNHIWLNPA